MGGYAPRALFARMIDYFTFSRIDAEQYGVDGAVMLHHIRYWVAKNEANDHNYRDGKYWTYNTQSALAQLFPYWSARKVGRILSKLEEEGAIESGNYNDKKYDRTKWFTLSNGIDKTGDVHLSKLTNANTEIVEPIPDNNQRTKHNTNIVYPWDSELFKKTWDIWKQYKKEQFNFKYANKYTEQAQLKKLTNLAQNEEQKAIELIEYAIAEGWKGFYPIRNKATTSNGFDAEKYRAHLESL